VLAIVTHDTLGLLLVRAIRTASTDGVPAAASGPRDERASRRRARTHGVIRAFTRSPARRATIPSASEERRSSSPLLLQERVARGAAVVAHGGGPATSERPLARGPRSIRQRPLCAPPTAASALR
jgi:hypothetical protein